MSPMFFNFTIFGWLILGSMFYFLGWTWFLLAPLFLCSLGFFWTKWFFYFGLKLGLKKKGYKGKVELISINNFLEEVYLDS
jgi:hypothetical protein